jgi:hypothetical protein
LSLDSLTSLKRNTVELLNLFNARVERMRNKEGYRAIIKELDEAKAKETLIKLLGKGTFKAIGIDGSMDQVESLEMLLFYVNAAAYSCDFSVSEEGVKFGIKGARKENKLGTTSAVPLWLEDCATVAAAVGSQESEFEHTAALMNISFSLMLMAELTSALASFKDEKLKILFLDRPLSGSYHTLGRDVRNLLLKESTPLERLYEGDLKRDLYLATAVPAGDAPIARHGPYAVHALIQRLVEGASLAVAVADMGLEPAKAASLEEALLRKDNLYDFLDKGLDEVKAKDECQGFRIRLDKLASKVTTRLFSSEEYPLRVDGEWLTTVELNAVNYLLLGSLVETARRRGVLLLGLTKDTGSSDVTRSVLGLCGIPDSLKPGMRHDRVMLSIISATNPKICVPPWRSVGYDSSFSTLTENTEAFGGVTPRLRAARKVASRECLFVRTYFQTRASSKTPYRSPVFLLDRPYDPKFDDELRIEFEYVERAGLQKMEPYLEGSKVNELDNALLLVLAGSDNPEVFEAYGHNALLYLADKAVKADVRIMHGALEGLVNLELTPLARKENLFAIVRRYRDARSEMEASRDSHGAQG